MSSSNSAAAWAPGLDLTPTGLAQFDPARVQQAIDDGYRSGYQAGHAEAMAAGERAVAAEIDRFRGEATALLDALARGGDALAAAEEATSQMFAATVAEAALRLATAVVGRELSDETTAAVAAVERALATLGRRPGVVLELHPDDAALVDEATLPDGVQVERNPSLSRGDALAHTDDRTVDARIAAALDRVAVTLTGGLA